MTAIKFGRSKKRTLSIDLLGGIGNQLFRYYAAIYIAEKLDLRVKFFLNDLPENHSQFNSRILDLGYPISPKSRPYTNFYSLISKKLLGYMSSKYLFIEKVIKFFRGIHTEEGMGAQEECNLIAKKLKRFPYPRNIHLEGHFQDIMYFLNQDKAKIEAQLRMQVNQVSPFLILQNLNHDLESLCVVHIRRGDFKNHTKDIGLLGKKYYENAMSNFVLNCKTPHFLIISDEMSEAELMVADEHRHLCTFLKDSEQMKPADLITMLNVCKNFILSNSTFSLWIALLARETKYVSYPMPFNLNLALQVRGFPNSWKPEIAYFE